MLSHGNICSNVVAGLERLQLRDTDECLSFLPLSHIFERMAGHYCMSQSGTIINYATSIDTVSAEMVERSPKVVLSVPAAVREDLRPGPGGRAVRVRAQEADLLLGQADGGAVGGVRAGRKAGAGRHRAQEAIADRLVFSKLKARTGGQLRFFVSGGAPLAPDIAKFFFAAGLPIHEGYGLTETSPVIAVNGFGQLKIGTVGRPIDGRRGPDRLRRRDPDPRAPTS